MTTLCDDKEASLVRMLKNRPGVHYSASELGAGLVMAARTVRATLSHLRRDHAAPIASNSTDGFSWPTSREAVDRTVAQIESRIAEMKQVAEGVRAGGEWLFGQAGTGQMGLGL